MKSDVNRSSHTPPARHQYGRQWYRRRRALGRELVWGVVIGAIGAYLLFHHGRFPERRTLALTSPQRDTVTATFPTCGDERRVTCVVDGDTFWLDSVKIRIADIDAPELSPPRCEAERARGEAAKYRLQELLNAGAFSLISGDRDEDRYGRKLRTVTRGGRSIGDTLVTEGLARRWDGTRRPWCS